jgi:hypothetical protein
MTKKAVIHQPDFLPYIGFFHRLLDADVWIALDHVQFTRGGSDCWIHRDKIKTPNGKKWVVLGIKKCPLKTPINEVRLLETSDWKIRNLNQIKENYRKAPFFNEFYPYIKKIYDCSDEKMSNFNIRTIQILLELFEIDIEIVCSSKFNLQSKRNEMLVDILNKIGAKVYISGTGAKNYFKPTLFEEAGIEVIWHKFEHPVYPQMYGKFVNYLSSIDLLFNVGIEKSRQILKNS